MRCYLCQRMGQSRYFVAASWTGAAVVEKLAATWCSKPCSQMYRSSSCMFGNLHHACTAERV
jgi:hypothetical protein